MASSPPSAPVRPSPGLTVVVIALSVWQLCVVIPSVARLWLPLGTFGYSVDSAGHVSDVGPSSPAARAGLASGDTIDVTATPYALRRYAAGSFTDSLSPGTTITLPVRTPTADRRVTMTSISEELSPADKVAIVLRTLGAIVFIVVGSGLVLLRPSAMTYAFFFYAIGTNPGSDGLFDSALPAGLYIANWTAEVLAVYLGYIGFLIFALRFPHSDIAGWRLAISRAIPFVSVILLGVTAYSVIAPFAFGTAAEPAASVSFWSSNVVLLAGIAALLATYVQARGLERQRIKWVLLGFALAIPGFVLSLLLLVVHIPLFTAPYWLASLFLCLNLLVPIAIAYAIIHHHVIDVSFVVSRAVVYAALTGLLVAAFALIEFVIGQHLAGLAVAIQVAVSIGFAFWLNAIHNRINILIDSTLFRRRHQAERQLAQIARALPHASTEQTVDRMLVDEPLEALDLASAALFRIDQSGKAVLARSRGWHDTCATSLDPDDAMVLRLSADQTQLDLRELRWHRPDVPQLTARPLLATPIVVRRRLAAFVLYSGHSGGEALDPTEQRAAGALAIGAAAAYDHLEAEYLRQRIGELEAELGIAKS